MDDVTNGSVPTVIEDPGGEGPPIVFNHSQAATETQFAPLADELRRIYRTIRWQPEGLAPDAGEAGGSSDQWDAAQQLFSLLNDLGIERAIVIGASDGGEVAVRAALLHPDRVRALVLIDTAADADDVADRLEELAMPVLVMHGTANREVAVSRAYEISAAVSDPRGTVEIVGAAQQPTQSHHEAMTPAIRAFLEGLPA